MTENDIRNIIAFLDRVTVTGHQERNIMNATVQKLMNMLPPPEEKALEESEDD